MKHNLQLEIHNFEYEEGKKVNYLTINLDNLVKFNIKVDEKGKESYKAFKKCLTDKTNEFEFKLVDCRK